MEESSFRYHAFGLEIGSHIELPALRPSDAESETDIVIEAGVVPEQGLENPKSATPFHQSESDRLWLNVPNIARFLVCDGKRIVVEAVPGADEQSVRLYLLGSCIGAILHQRKVLVMHGNAVRFGDRCVIFAGPSGAGKSTLAAAFHQRGHDILADDVCAVDGEGRVAPSFPQLKLWQDAASKLEIDTSSLDRIRHQVEKYAYPLEQSFFEHLPVAAVYILTSNNRDEFKIEPVKGMKRFNPLKNNTYRVGYLEGLGMKTEHLALCSKLAARIHLARIIRPSNGFNLAKLLALILADLAEQGILMS